MRAFFKQIAPAIRALFVLTFIVGGLYPLLIRGVGQLLFPHQANGSLIERSDRTLAGSHWLGQNFTGAKYFHPRPSAAGTTGYDGAASGGSNLGPTSQLLVDAVRRRVAAYRLENHLAPAAVVPADAVTASGSGLDPHISVKNAALQAPRVAKARGMSLETVQGEIAKATTPATFGLLGEPGVTVLELNLALDQLDTR